MNKRKIDFFFAANNVERVQFYFIIMEILWRKPDTHKAICIMILENEELQRNLKKSKWQNQNSKPLKCLKLKYFLIENE